MSSEPSNFSFRSSPARWLRDSSSVAGRRTSSARRYTLADHKRELPRAEQLIRSALAAEPDNPALLDSLGWVLYQRGQYDEAQKALEKAIALSPGEPVILEHLGDVYAKEHDGGRALGAYQKALAAKADAKPDDADVARLRTKIHDIQATLAQQRP